MLLARAKPLELRAGTGAMKEKFIELLAREIGKLPADTVSSREGVYARVRAIIEQQAQRSDGTRDDFVFENLRRDLNASIAYIERTKKSKDAILFYLAAVAGVVSVCDFLKPVINDSTGVDITLVYFGAGLVLTVGLLYAHRFVPDYALQFRRLSYVTAFMALLGGLFFLGNAALGGGNSGFIAKGVPGAERAQNALLGVERKLDEIHSTVGTLKKETSDDPRKELANMGIAWTPEALSNALLGRDERAVKLFLRGGHRVEAHQLATFLETRFDSNIAALLRTHKSLVDQTICEKDAVPLPASPGSAWKQADFIRSSAREVEKKQLYFVICNPQTVRTRYEAKANELRNAISGYTAAIAKRNEHYRTCVGELETKHFSKARGLRRSEAMAAAADVYVEARRRPLPKVLPPEFERKFESTMRNHAIFDLATRPGLTGEGMFAHVMEMGCQDAYEKPAPKDPSELQSIQAILDLIPAG